MFSLSVGFCHFLSFQGQGTGLDALVIRSLETIDEGKKEEIQPGPVDAEPETPASETSPRSEETRDAVDSLDLARRSNTSSVDSSDSRHSSSPDSSRETTSMILQRDRDIACFELKRAGAGGPAPSKLSGLGRRPNWATRLSQWFERVCLRAARTIWVKTQSVRPPARHLPTPSATEAETNIVRQWEEYRSCQEPFVDNQFFSSEAHYDSLDLLQYFFEETILCELQLCSDCSEEGWERENNKFLNKLISIFDVKPVSKQFSKSTVVLLLLGLERFWGNPEQIPEIERLKLCYLVFLGESEADSITRKT